MKAHPVRTLILLILTFAQAVCAFGGIITLSGLKQELDRSKAQLGADILVYPTAAVSKISTKTLLMQGTPVRVYRNRSLLSRMDSCEDIDEVSYQIYISDTLENGENIWIVGFDPEADFVLSPWAENGESLNMPAGSVAAGSDVEISDDNTVTLFERKWPVAAHLLKTGSGLDSSVFVSMETLKEFISASKDIGIDDYKNVNPETDFSVALVRVTDKLRVESVTDWINIYVRKVTAVRSEETLIQAASGISGAAGMMAVITFIIWLILLLSLSITQSMLMKERKKEIFVWYAAGASRSLVKRIMLAEALIIHLAGGLTGILITALVFSLFGNRLIPGFTLNAWLGFSAAFISLSVTLISGLFVTNLAVSRTANTLNGQMLLTL